MLHLTKEEKLELENSLLKEQNLTLQIQGIQTERQKVVGEFCKRVNQKPEDIIRWDLNSGIDTEVMGQHFQPLTLETEICIL